MRPDEEEEEEALIREKIQRGLETRLLFSDTECEAIEAKIQGVVRTGEAGGYKRFTVDRAPLRTK